MGRRRKRVGLDENARFGSVDLLDHGLRAAAVRTEIDLDGRQGLSLLALRGFLPDKRGRRGKGSGRGAAGVSYRAFNTVGCHGCDCSRNDRYVYSASIIVS